LKKKIYHFGIFFSVALCAFSVKLCVKNLIAQEKHRSCHYYFFSTIVEKRKPKPVQTIFLY